VVILTHLVHSTGGMTGAKLIYMGGAETSTVVQETKVHLDLYQFLESMSTQQQKPCQILKVTQFWDSMNQTINPRITSHRNGRLLNGSRYKQDIQTRHWCLPVQLLVVVMDAMEETLRIGSQASLATALN